MTVTAGANTGNGAIAMDGATPLSRARAPGTYVVKFTGATTSAFSIRSSRA